MPEFRQAAEADVRSWGFKTVYTWTDGPNAYYPPHSHAGLTTHLILSGSFTVAYPKEESSKEMFGPGARIDVPAKRLHQVWMGPEGCTYVIGE